MANIPSAPFSTMLSSINAANPFTSKDTDDLPPSPDLPTVNPSRLTKTSSPETMALPFQIIKENEQLKAELFAIHAQRAAEQQAYSNFIKAIEALNIVLPEHAKTIPMRTALRNLVEISGGYRTVATEINERRKQAKRVPEEFLPRRKEPQQHLTQQPMATNTATFQLHTPGSFVNLTSFTPAPPNLQIEQQNMVFLLKEALSQLQISRPKSDITLDESLIYLKNNVKSFAAFVVLYLNGRHGHFTSKLRPEINGAIGGFFADEDDAKQVVGKVMKIIKNGVRYTEQDVQRLSDDIVKPMGAVLWNLVTFLETKT